MEPLGAAARRAGSAGRAHRSQEALGPEDSAGSTYSEDIIAIFHTHTDEGTRAHTPVAGVDVPDVTTAS